MIGGLLFVFREVVTQRDDPQQPVGHGLRAPDEVDDQHHEQDDHEDSDQAVTHICLLLL